MKIMFVKVRAALQAANGELDAQHQCSVCHIFASTRDALQVSASHLFLILTHSVTGPHRWQGSQEEGRLAELEQV